LKVRLAKRATLRGDALPIATKRTSAFDHLALFFQKLANVAVELSKAGDNVAQVVREQAKRASHGPKLVG
jgi:hypothetical protein